MNSLRLCAASIVLAVASTASAQERKPISLPPELSWVPPNSMLFASVHLDPLWKSRAGKIVRDFYADLGPEMQSRLGGGLFGLTLDQIDRLTLVVPDLDDDRDPTFVIRVTMREPYDRNRVLNSLKLMDRDAGPRGLGGTKSLYHLQRHSFLHLTDAKNVTFIISGDGAPSLAAKLLEREPAGKLTPALEAAGAGEHIVVGFDPVPLRAVAPPDQLPDEIQPILEAGLVVLRGTLKDDDIELSLKSAFPNQAAAEAGAKAMSRLRNDAIEHLNESLQRLEKGDVFAVKLFGMIVAALKDAKFSAADGQLTGTAVVRTDEFLRMLAKDGARSLRSQLDHITIANQLKQIALACHNYCSANINLPINLRDRANKPLLSWRVAILPYLEEDVLYREFRLDEPWDSEHNKKLIAKMPKIYQGKNKKLNEQFKTTVLGPAGDGMLFDPALKKGVSLEQLTSADGTSNTILAVNASDDAAVIWTKPDDLPVDPKDPLKGLIRAGSDYLLFVMGDGAVRRISPRINPKQLNAAFTWRDGAIPDWEDLLMK